MKFGENLYKLRKNSKMSQEKLADRVGVSRQSVSKWETGESYPEMNRILELCKIFHCQLNDLVNDQILDYNSLDEDVKVSVVKFNKEKQRKLKGISKTISVISRILQIIAITISIVMFVGMLFIPSMINNSEISSEKIIVAGKELAQIGVDTDTYNTLVQVFNEHSRTELIIYGEIIVISLIITILLVAFAMMYLSKLFDNISEGETPFTLDNMKYIKMVAILFGAYLVFPDISGMLFQLITKIDMRVEVEIAKVFYFLIIICIYYVFDYGHQIQLDSKGRIYGEENE